jgi:hypothetical protein
MLIANVTSAANPIRTVARLIMHVPISYSRTKVVERPPSRHKVLPPRPGRVPIEVLEDLSLRYKVPSFRLLVQEVTPCGSTLEEYLPGSWLSSRPHRRCSYSILLSMTGLISPLVPTRCRHEPAKLFKVNAKLPVSI